MEINGKVVIITGASGGIGAATARELARHGAIVVLAARRADELERLKTELESSGARALAVPADVSRREEIDRLVRTTLESFGRIDVLVNNAGLSPGKPIDAIEDERMSQVIAVNLLGPMRLANAVVPQMRRQGGGVIINIGSVAGEIAPTSVYAASKFGLRGLNDGMRRELRRDKINVVLIAPGLIRTRMTTGAKIPMPGPEVIARAVASAIRRPRRKIVVPWYYRPLMFVAKLWPWIADAVIGSNAYQSSYRKRKRIAEQAYQQQARQLEEID